MATKMAVENEKQLLDRDQSVIIKTSKLSKDDIQ